MHGEEANAGFGDALDGAGDGFGNVVELEIEEHLLAVLHQAANQVHAGGGVQLEADLVEVDARADSLDESACGRRGFHVERDDDGVRDRFRGHKRRIGFSPRASTRPMRQARVSFAASASGSVNNRPPEVWGS